MTDRARSQPPAGNERGRFDAFLSYAHEDKAVVAWLGTYLATTWVPGKRRREIFRDIRIVAGPLDDELRDKLRRSRFLIVCCSPAAKESRWVGQEIDAFLELHRDDPSAPDRVLACWVGGEGDAPTFPEAFVALQRRLAVAAATTSAGTTAGTPTLDLDRTRELYVPDLRGFHDGSSRRERRALREAAAALLAPLVDLRDRDAVLARVARRRALLLAAGMLVAIAVGGGGWAWMRWLQTPEGALFDATRKMLAMAGERTVTDESLLAAARGFGAMGQPTKVERLALYPRDPDYGAIIVGLGRAAADPPDCDGAVDVLRKVDSAAASSRSQAHLLTNARCAHPLAPVEDVDTISDLSLLPWVERFAAAGDLDAARTLLARGDLPAGERLQAKIAFALAAREPVSASADDLEEWAAGRDELDLLWNAGALLRILDLHDAANDPIARRVADVAIAAADQLDPDAGAHWEAAQELAAHLAVFDAEAARRLLDRSSGTHLQVHPDFADGWAWRGLAWQRIGDEASSATAFAMAEETMAASAPASRDWREVVEVQLAYVLAGRWVEAFRSVDVVGIEQIQIVQRAELIGLWAKRVGHVPWPWRVEGLLRSLAPAARS